jgi:hypothetical protein
MDWWLPDDEGYPPIIRSIRKFVEERTSHATDLPGEDLRDMKAIFASLNLDDGPAGLPTDSDKGKGHAVDQAVASDQGWATSALSATDKPPSREMGQGDSEPYGFDDAQQYWSSEQSGHSYELPKPGGYP